MTGTFRSSFAIVFTTLAIGATSLYAQPARTAEPVKKPWEHCSSKEFCVATEQDGTGRVASFQAGAGNLNAPGLFGGKLNDKVSAVWNRTDRPWCLYEHADTREDRGHWKKIEPGKPRSISQDVEHDGFHWNDKVSSLEAAHRSPRHRGYVCQGEG